MKQRNYTSQRVVIVGGGPVGLTAGIALQQFGVNCEIMEQRHTLATASKGLMISPASLHVFERLGIVSELEQQSYKVKHANLYWQGKRMYRLPFHQMPTPFNYLVMLPQPVTESILRERFLDLGGVIHDGTELISVQQMEKGVRAAFRDASGDYQVECEHLVAADGSRSQVRQSLAIACEESKPGFMHFILGDFKVTWPGGDLEETHYFVNDESFMIVLPLNEQYHRVFFKGDGEYQRDAPIDMERIRQVARKIAPTDLQVSDPIWLSAVNHHSRIADGFVHGRVYLVGDAAHSFSPMGGQGMNTGLQDAYNLAWRLALVVRQEASQESLLRYSEERVAVARATTASVMLNTKLMCREEKDPQGPLKRFIPNRDNANFLRYVLPGLMSGINLQYALPTGDRSLTYFAVDHTGKFVPLLSQHPLFKQVFNPQFFTLLLFNPSEPAALTEALQPLLGGSQEGMKISVICSEAGLAREISSQSIASDISVFCIPELNELFRARANAALLVRPDLIAAWQGGISDLNAADIVPVQYDLAG